MKEEEVAARHAKLVELVGCVRQHGVYVPEPDAHNNIDTSKVNIKSPHVRAVVKACNKGLSKRKPTPEGVGSPTAP